MKLIVKIDTPLNGKTFGSGEEVRGRVELPVDKSEAAAAAAAAVRMPDVVVVFQGIAWLSIIPQTTMEDMTEMTGGSGQRTHSHTLFTHSISVKPKASTADSGRIVYVAPFSFRFPAGSSFSGCCGNGTACMLPPSLFLNTTRVQARVVYSVTATARRMKQTGLHLLPMLWRRQLRMQMVLAFAPRLSMSSIDAAPEYGSESSVGAGDSAGDGAGDVPIPLTSPIVPVLPTPPPTPPSSPPSSPSSRRPSSAAAAALVCAATLLPCGLHSLHSLHSQSLQSSQSAQSSATATAIPSSLPPYSPSITLELVMLQPAVIAPGGGGIALGVFLRTPQAHLLIGGSGATLRSVHVQLRRETAARIGNAVAFSPPVCWPLWSVEGAVPLRQERIDVAEACGGAWASQCCVPAEAQPTFQSCYLSRAYSIEVELGISSTPTSTEIRHIHSFIDVVVSEPPPEYCDERACHQQEGLCRAADLDICMGRPPDCPVMEVRV